MIILNNKNNCKWIKKIQIIEYQYKKMLVKKKKM